MGFEALSRGANSVVMIDQYPQVVQKLHENAQLLGATSQTEIFCRRVEADFPLLLSRQFDIVFLDPPFHQGWISRCCQLLAASHCLSPNALVYIEAESDLQPLPIPADWLLLRSQKAGQVGYYLAQA